MSEAIHRGKLAAARRAAEMVKPGMRLGLGTGSTAALFLQALGERIAEEGLQIQGVPTSQATAAAAQDLGIPLIPLEERERLDLTVDGADEISPTLDLVKGGGGALVREKLVARHTRGDYLVIADDSKWVPALGAFPLPVAVLPFGWKATAAVLAGLGAPVELRRDAQGEPLLTDDHLHVLDCAFGAIPDPGALEEELEAIPGVVACGIFHGLATRAFLGSPDGLVREVPEVSSTG